MASDPLAHIPGGKGPPLIGHTLSFLRDARRLLNTMQAEQGDVSRRVSWVVETSSS